jgi:hypothetical protein
MLISTKLALKPGVPEPSGLDSHTPRQERSHV